jgi:hypothetical protein
VRKNLRFKIYEVRTAAGIEALLEPGIASA